MKEEFALGEEKLKSTLDKGISVWLEPVGDKNKLKI